MFSGFITLRFDAEGSVNSLKDGRSPSSDDDSSHEGGKVLVTELDLTPDQATVPSKWIPVAMGRMHYQWVLGFWIILLWIFLDFFSVSFPVANNEKGMSFKRWEDNQYR